MRVLHVITSMKPGGAEKLMVDLLPKLKALGADAELAVFDGADTAFMSQLEESNVRVHKFTDEGCVYNPRHILRLKRIMSDFDVVHTHNTSPQLFAAVAASRLKRPPVMVTTEHNTTNRRRGNAILRAADRWMYRHYDSVVAITPQVRDAMISHIGENTVKTTVIPNGIDTSRFMAEADKRRKDDGMRELVMVAAFRAQKDHDTLIRAIKILPDRFRLRLVGRGDLESKYRKMVEDLGLQERVIFAGVRTDIPAVFRDSDYIVMSTHYEGLPISVLEAMCSGRPLIASDVPGVHELLSGAGVLFPDGDSEALAARIMELDKSPALCEKVIKNCMNRGIKYDISVMAKSYLQLYKNLLDR